MLGITIEKIAVTTSLVIEISPVLEFIFRTRSRIRFLYLLIISRFIILMDINPLPIRSAFESHSSSIRQAVIASESSFNSNALADRPPKTRTFREVSFATKSALRGRRFCREEGAVFGRAYSWDFKGRGPWGPGVGVVSAARYFGAKGVVGSVNSEATPFSSSNPWTLYVILDPTTMSSILTG